MIYGEHQFGKNIIIYENFNFEKTTFTVLVMHNIASFVTACYLIFLGHALYQLAQDD